MDIKEDKTNEKKYEKSKHDCDDFAEEFEDALEKKGWRVTIKGALRYENGKFKGHCFNDVYIMIGYPIFKNVTYVYKRLTIEPQSDEEVTDTYDQNGDLEVDTIFNPSKIKIQALRANLKKTGKGNEGKYLIFEFEDMKDFEKVFRRD